jgi:hypothetical protein
LNGPDIILDGISIGYKVIGVGSGGTLELHGAKGSANFMSWTNLAQDALKGSNILKLATDITTPSGKIDWEVGDSILLTSTDYNPYQSEDLFITKILDSKTIQVNKNLNWNHFGRFTFGVDERAEVALMSRNILIRGIEDGTQFGGHLIVRAGTKAVKIEGNYLFKYLIEFEYYFYFRVFY